MNKNSLININKNPQMNMKKNKYVNNQQIIIKMGKYTLQYPQNHSKKKPISKQIIKQLKNIESDTLDLSWGKFQRYKWNKIIKYLKKCDVQQVLASGNLDMNILRYISNVQFNHLKYLDLRDCMIQNLQFLPFTQKLQTLSLMNNRIRSIHSLTKYNLANLKTLLLNDNPIMKMNLGRCNFDLEVFWLQRKFNTQIISQCLSQSDMFKFKSQNMKSISIQSSYRIYQPILIQKIHKKFKNIQRLLYTSYQDQFEDQLVYIDDQEQVSQVQEIEEIQQLNLQNQPVAQICSIQGLKVEDSEDWSVGSQQNQQIQDPCQSIIGEDDWQFN